MKFLIMSSPVFLDPTDSRRKSVSGVANKFEIHALSHDKEKTAWDEARRPNKVIEYGY